MSPAAGRITDPAPDPHPHDPHPEGSRDIGGARPAVRAATAVRLTAAVRTRLKTAVRRHQLPRREWIRMMIVLLAGRGWTNARIALKLGVHVDTVRKWRDRFAVLGEDGLADAPRSGRPRTITALERAQIIALACQLPAQTGVPLARWSGPELRREVVTAGICGQISASSILRILAENPIKPWQYRSWITPRDPDFAAKARVILDLYQGVFQGEKLGPNDRVISVDAKPSIQARTRCAPTLPPAPGRPMRIEHEYVRNGHLALLACLDVHTGTVQATTPKTTGIAPFMQLMGQVMSADRYKNADRVFVLVDNGSDHRGKAAIRRLAAAHPNCIMIHTPVHASWLNQVEIFLSIIQRKVVSPNDFTGTDQLAATLQAFIDRYNLTAKPFAWKYTSADLDNTLAKIAAHRPEPSAADKPGTIENPAAGKLLAETA